MSDDTKKYKLSLLECIGLAVSDIIGSGIFLTPQGILEKTGSIGLSLSVWAGCGLLAMLGGLCYVELGTSIRKTGQDYAYLTYVGWYPIAFMQLWATVIIYRPCTLGVLSRTFGQYVVAAFKQHLCFSDQSSDILERLLGFMMLFLLLALNFKRIDRFSGIFGVVAMFCKVGSLLVIVGCGIYYATKHGWSKLDDPWKNTTLAPGSLVLAVYSGLWDYDGWQTLNIIVEEMKNPTRNLPFAIFGSLGICVTIYLMVNISYLVVLGRDGVLSSLAVGEAISAKTLGWFAQVLPWIIGIVLAGTLNASMFSGARFYVAAAREGHFPSMYKLTNIREKTPQLALITSVCLGMILGSIANVNNLIDYLIFVSWLGRFFAMCALIWIRFRKIPVHKDAIRVPIIFHIIFMIICAALVVIPIVQSPEVTAIGLGICASGLVIYFIFVRPKKKPQILLRIDRFLLVNGQKLTFALPDNAEAEQENNTTSANNDVSRNDGPDNELRLRNAVVERF